MSALPGCNLPQIMEAIKTICVKTLLTLEPHVFNAVVG